MVTALLSLVEQLAALTAEVRTLNRLLARRTRILGPANVLTVTEALRELNMGDTEGTQWLQERGLIHHPGRSRRGSGRVIAGDLAAAVADGAMSKTRRVAPQIRFPKTTAF